MFGKLTNQQNNIFKTNTITPPIQVPKTKPIKKNKKSEKRDLMGAKFRMLNELLYTSTSEEAVKYFSANSKYFDVYHEGFRRQAEKWPNNPVHTIIKYLRNNAADKVVYDLGCGDALIQEKLSTLAQIRSFDLVSTKQSVEVADIAHLPVQANSAHICVFCLSLMGTNYVQFLRQAQRVIKNNGTVIIAEVQSRCDNWKRFIKLMQGLGFSNNLNKSNNYFRLLHFCSNLRPDEGLVEKYGKDVLSTCTYKKR